MAVFKVRNSGPIDLRNIKSNIPNVVDAENSGRLTAENVVVDAGSKKAGGYGALITTLVLTVIGGVVATGITFAMGWN